MCVCARFNASVGFFVGSISGITMRLLLCASQPLLLVDLTMTFRCPVVKLSAGLLLRLLCCCAQVAAQRWR
jgi:hypothetical protein